MREDRDIEATLVAARDLWADFPVHADPRPLVLTGGIFRVPGFTSDEAKKAFTQGAIEVADRVPDPALRSLRRALPPRRPGGPALLLSAATSIESSFDTDRGPARLAAWQFDVSDTPGPMVVLDAGIVDRAWTPAGLPEDLHFMSRGDAVQSDPVTFTYRFMGSPSVYTDYPDVMILESPTVVVITPRTVDRPGSGVRLAYAQLREVRVDLSTPLGDRVMLAAGGLPVTVHRPDAPDS